MKLRPSKKWIVFDTNPLLRAPNAILDTNNISSEDKKFMNMMRTYVDESYDDNAEKHQIRPGIGIAAPQIGWNKQVFYIHADDEQGTEHQYFIANPYDVRLGVNTVYLPGGEGCLSVDVDKEGIVPRKQTISFMAYDLLEGKVKKFDLSGMAAVIAQHELDHLNQKLYYDRINPFNATFVDQSWLPIIIRRD